MKANQLNQEFWDELMSYNESELEIKLGLQLQNSISMVPSNNEKVIIRAKVWLEQNKEAICSSKKIKKAIETSDIYIILAAIADALGGSGAATAAVLILKKGLENICKNIA